MIAKISPLLRLPSTADVFDYFVPPDLEPKIKLGQLVAIPWRSEEIQGVVLELVQENSLSLEGRGEYRARPIHKIVNPEPILSKAQLILIKKFSAYYFCPPGAVARLIIPPAPKRTIIKPAKIRESITIKIDKAQLAALAKAAANLNKQTDSITVQDFSSFIWLIFYLLKQPAPGGLVLLFPTIALLEKAQTILSSQYAADTVIIHSQLSKGAYWRSYQKILTAAPKIILATRQGVFLPIPAQSRIVMWNAASDDFKQTDQHPRYDARLAASWLSKATNSQLIFTASNPLLFEEGEGGGVVGLPAGSSVKTTIKVVDMKKEFALRDFSVISEITSQAMTLALEQKQKVVIIVVKNENKVAEALTKGLKNVKDIIVTTPAWLESAAARAERGQIGCLVIPSVEPLLGMPDYRAQERVYYRLQEWKLWAQELLIPKIILQSYAVENLAIRAFAYGETDAFIQSELKHRQALDYPPFIDLIKISYKAEDPAELRRVLIKLKDTGAKVLGPYKEFKTKRQSWLLKVKNNIDIPFLRTLPAKWWAVDRDPENVL